MSIEIKRIDGTVAYESQSATSLKEAAEEAVRDEMETIAGGAIAVRCFVQNWH